MQENGKLTVLNMQDILPNRFQPRIRFDEEKLEELALSIGKYGVIQPIVVRPVGNKFEIIAGERRFKASRLANRSTIPAIVINLSDKDSEEIALLENVQRQQLNPIEEAVSYKRILDMGYINQEQLAKKIGKSQSTIVNKIRLLNLDDEVQSYLLNNKISERHARSLLRISNKDKQVSMLHRIVEERLTVKQTDREVAKLKEFDSDSFKKVNDEVDQSEGKILNENKANKVDVQFNPVINEKIETEEIENLFDDSEKDERGNYMDIEKIMKEAKDINVSQPVEKKDISNLMVPESGIQGESTLEVEAIPNVENKKFISVQPQSQESPSFSSQNGGVTFDSVFNQGLNIPTSTNPDVNVNSQVNSSNISDSNVNLEVKQSIIPDVNTNSTLNSNKLGDVSINMLQNGVSDVKKEAEPNVEISNEMKSRISNAVAIALKKHNESSVKTITNVPSAVNQNVSMNSSSISRPSNTSKFMASNVNVPNAVNQNVSMNSSSISSPSNASKFMASNVNVPNAVPVSPLNQAGSVISNIDTSNVDIPNSVNQNSNINFEFNNSNASMSGQINQEKFVNSDVNISNTGISDSNKQVVSTPPIINNVNVGSTGSGNSLNSNYYNVPDTDIINDVPFNDYVKSEDISSTMASPISQSVKPVNNHSNFASIVKMLRDCADKIEANGYFVNVDELDLDNQYKVIFTINKE